MVVFYTGRLNLWHEHKVVRRNDESKIHTLYTLTTLIGTPVPTYLCSYPINQSRGSNAMHTIMQVQVKISTYCSHQTSEWANVISVILIMAWLLVLAVWIWVFQKRDLGFLYAIVFEVQQFEQTLSTEWCEKQKTLAVRGSSAGWRVRSGGHWFYLIVKLLYRIK